MKKQAQKGSDSSSGKLSISLPRGLKRYVHDAVAQEAKTNPEVTISSFFRQLLRQRIAAGK